MPARSTRPKKKTPAKPSLRAEPADVLVARALSRLSAVDRRDAKATAAALAELFAILAAHLDSDSLDDMRRRTLTRRVRAARLKTLGRLTKRTRHASKAPPIIASAAPDASWLPKTLHAAGVVEGHEPTAVVLGLLREALTSAATKRDAQNEAAAPVRPLPVVLADLFGAFGLSRSPSLPRNDDSKGTPGES